MVMTGAGSPETVLQEREIEVPSPGPHQIRVAVRRAGVGPTDLAIRAGRLRGVFPDSPGTVLGFEAAGTVDAVGSAVDSVRRGDAVAVFLPTLGGYAESALAEHWVVKPDSVDWDDAAALPASGEAAVRVLGQLDVLPGQTLLVLGAAGSVGRIATQLAVARGVTVVGAVRPDNFALVEGFGAQPVGYGSGLVDGVHAITDKVDAVFDAARSTDLPAALSLVGDARRVITLTDHRAAELGVTLSGPSAEGIGRSLEIAMTALANREVRLQPRTLLPLLDVATAHRELENGQRTIYVLTV